MKKSNEVNELFSALAKAQAELKSIPFDSKNPHFGNEFASLTAIQDGTRKILSKHGLSISQVIDTEETATWLHTILGHSSGQYIQSSIRLVLIKNSMQELGSASSYAKRYAWQAMIGVCGDQDDDGQVAAGRGGGAPVAPRQYAPQSTAEPKEFREAREQREKNDKEAARLLGNGAPAPTESPALQKSADPGDYIIPFGEQYGMKGKRLRELNESMIKQTLGWIDGCEAKGQLHSTQVEFRKQAKEFLVSMGVKA